MVLFREGTFKNTESQEDTFKPLIDTTIIVYVVKIIEDKLEITLDNHDGNKLV